MSTQQRIVVDRYRVLEQLGSGAMGVVWRAWDELIGRPVALKEIPVPHGSSSEKDAFRQRVLREARNAGRLTDPAVVTVYDVASDERAAYVVMELIDAPTLAEVLERGPLPAQQAARVGLQVL